jgi:Tfp pilus assembly protein PilN
VIELNLLPEELRKDEETALTFEDFPVQKWLIIFTVVFFSAQALASLAAVSLAHQLSGMKKEVARLTSESKDILAQKVETHAVKKRLKEAEEVMERKFYWSRLLNALTDSVTKGVWLTRLSTEGEKEAHVLLIEGSAVGRGEESAFIGRFMKELKKNPVFADLFDEMELAHITQKKVKDADVYDFVARCAFKKGKF